MTAAEVVRAQHSKTTVRRCIGIYEDEPCSLPCFGTGEINRKRHNRRPSSNTSNNFLLLHVAS